MRANVLEAIGRLSFRSDVPEPEPGSDDVIVRAKACGVCGTDVHIFDGEFFPTFPLIMGHELAGEVVALGSAVTTLKVGDKVMVDPTVTCEKCHFCMINRQNHCLAWNAVGVTRDGGFAELVKVPAKNCYAFTGVSYREAAFCEPLACVVFGQDRLAMDVGSDVLVIGAGPIGQLHLQTSLANGAARVTVVDVMESKLDVAKAHGAANVARADKDLPAALAKIAPYGFDAVIDATGVAKVVQDSLRYVKSGGKYLIFGVCGPHDTASISPFEVYRRDLQIIGSFAIRRTYDRAFKLVESGRVKMGGLIHESIHAQELPRAIEMMKRGQAPMKLQIVWE